jgi:hypothetical protein
MGPSDGGVVAKGTQQQQQQQQEAFLDGASGGCCCPASRVMEDAAHAAVYTPEEVPAALNSTGLEQPRAAGAGSTEDITPGTAGAAAQVTDTVPEAVGAAVPSSPVPATTDCRGQAAGIKRSSASSICSKKRRQRRLADLWAVKDQVEDGHSRFSGY